MTKKMLVATIVAIVLAATALPVLAKPPDHFSDSFPQDPLLVADCGDFQVWTKDSMIAWEGTIHYDQEGNPIRVITHWWGQDTFWNPDNGKVATMEYRLLNSFDDLTTGETIGVGIQAKLTVPGEGTLLIDTGRLVFNPFPDIVFAAGRHPFWMPEEGDFDKLCAYFAE